MRRKVSNGIPVSASLLEGANPEQSDVIQHGEGPLMVAAVAGSGKTFALVRRMAYLIEERGIDPWKILAMTFSKKAADEMNERLVSILGETQARVGTFHSWAYELLRNEQPAYKEWTVDDRDKFRVFVKDAVGFREMNWKGADLTKLMEYIAFCKACLAKPGSQLSLELAAKRFGGYQASMADEAYQRAERRRLDERYITFDDMLVVAVDLLRDPESGVLLRWGGRYDYVLQDECQDVNDAQNEIARLLSKEHRNYMVVGDPMQSIYAFRGARPETMLTFEQEWGARVIHMNRNYRCGRRIVEVANNVARPAVKRLPMEIVGERDVEGRISFQQTETLDDEAQHVLDVLREEKADGKRWGDFVVLYRTNAQSRAPEEVFLKARIPYTVVGGTNFYERKEVKDMLAYLRLAEGRGSADDVRRCINSPFRFLGRAYVERVMSLRGDEGSWTQRVLEAATQEGIQQRQIVSAQQWSSLVESAALEVKEGKRPNLILETLLQKTAYLDWLRREEGEESPENSRVSNVRELVRASTRFETTRELLDYIDQVIKDSRKAKAAADSGERPDRVTLMTIHRSKGLEWPVVFVIGANEGILPHGLCEEEEERRLAYVAFTRARDALHVSAIGMAAMGGAVRSIAVSRFVAEAGLPAFVRETAPVDAAAEGGGDGEAA
jgi:DNA helicase-2/ATP-dependent DNA helicase PcrA